ncbi:hypothetical protein BJX65DRAFT_297291 [Aspergillus insuetus]
MSMIGLKSIKLKFLAIKAQVDTALRQNIDFKEERFGSVLLGNPGTGKTTVARIYDKFLTSMDIIPGSHIEETTGSRLANGGASGCEKQINAILNEGGGVLFIDEAYQLAQGGGMGSQVLDFLLAEIERLSGKVVVVLAGYRNQMEKFFAHNPRLPSRFPREFTVEDYNETELRLNLEFIINKKVRGRMKVEGGMGGLYCRIIARRISRQRGHEGFVNARTVENNLSRIYERQSKRLAEERRSKVPTDDLLLTKENVIGPEPSKALGEFSAWKKLQEMVGLGTVKGTMRALLDSIQTNYERELLEEPLTTTVAKLYGQILVDIGYLSNGEVVVKNPADFVGSVIGQSEQNTKGILASTVGKVLVIDEAYGLFGGETRDSAGSHTDPYKTAVVDTIVAEVQSVPGDNRCVLLLGYEEQMNKMFQNINPGLSRRFPMDAAFVFEDFSDDELGQILDLKLRQQGFKASAQARKVALEVLSRGRNSPHFGNAGEIDHLLNGAKLHFVPDFDRGDSNETNIPMLFQGYRQTVKHMRQLDMDPKEQVPFNFLFRRPPGTGKASTARKMGKVYYDMNLLSSAEVIESSATNFIGQYIGHTGPKTQELRERALGKEAMDETVDCITKPKFFQKLIIILAGYDNDINRLMAINPGLTSRFPESLEFKGLEPDDCIKLLINLLRSMKNKIFARLESFWKVVVITEDLVTDKLDDMIPERTTRAIQSSLVPDHTIDPSQPPAFDSQSEQIFYTAPSTAAPSVKDIAETADPALPVDKTETCPAGTPRDDGSLLEDEHEAQKAVDNSTSLPKDNSNLDDDAKRQHEQRRLEELVLRAKLEELQSKREAKEAERRKEQKAQQKLRQMGVCCMGYRCAGGSHYVSKVNLGV